MVNWWTRGVLSTALAATTMLNPAVGTEVRRPEKPTAAESVSRLKEGNARFVASPEEALPITAAGRNALVQGQSPFAAVLSCADSRVPPEVIFRAGLGELFVVRAAGHVPDHSVLASLEYAAEHLHAPLLLVMGHEACGAVRAAIDTPATSSLGVNLDFMLKAIRPSVAATASAPAETRLRDAILRNVEDTINELLTDSPILKHAAGSGALGLIGGYYELATGRVHFSELVLPPPGAGAVHR